MGSRDSTVQHLDCLVVGGGFAGVYNLYKLRESGFNVQLFDAAPDFGGIWRLNCYPCAMVDSEIPLYGLSIPKVYNSWNWTKRYPGFEELRKYFYHMDEVLDLRKDCRFSMRVRKALWNEDKQYWDVTAGPIDNSTTVTTQHVIFCLGFASKLNWPNVPGRETFKGDLYHSGNWPDGLDAEQLKGKRVAVVGSGASGVQCARGIGRHAKEMSVFIRTPNLCLPMNNKVFTPRDQEELKKACPELYAMRPKTFGGIHYDFDYGDWTRHTAEEREAFYEDIWSRGGLHFWLENYVQVYFIPDCNKTAYDFWQKKVSQRIKDFKKRQFLAPKEPPHHFGTVRPSLEQGYYEVLDQSNVEIVDAKQNPIVAFTEKGIKLKDGQEKVYDFIVLATGFDTHTGGYNDIDIRGKGDLRLLDKWSDICKSYLGLTTRDFPNMFFLYGPHAPTAYSNGPSTVEIQADWLISMIDHMRKNNYQSFQTQQQAEEDFTKHVDNLSAATLFHDSPGWYMGRNVPGKTSQALNYSGGIPSYIKDLEACSLDNYKGYDWIQ